MTLFAGNCWSYYFQVGHKQCQYYDPFAGNFWELVYSEYGYTKYHAMILCEATYFIQYNLEWAINVFRIVALSKDTCLRYYILKLHTNNDHSNINIITLLLLIKILSIYKSGKNKVTPILVIQHFIRWGEINLRTVVKSLDKILTKTFRLFQSPNPPI